MWGGRGGHDDSDRGLVWGEDHVEVLDGELDPGVERDPRSNFTLADKAIRGRRVEGH